MSQYYAGMATTDLQEELDHCEALLDWTEKEKLSSYSVTAVTVFYSRTNGLPFSCKMAILLYFLK